MYKLNENVNKEKKIYIKDPNRNSKSEITKVRSLEIFLFHWEIGKLQHKT